MDIVIEYITAIFLLIGGVFALIGSIVVLLLFGLIFGRKRS